MRFTSAAAAMALLAGCSAPEQAEAQDQASGTMLVANKRGNSLSRVDLATGMETHQVDSCANPHELAVSPDRRHVALACYDGQELEIFRTADLELVKRIPLGEGARPHGAFWHANGTLFASAEGRGSIFVVEEPLPISRTAGLSDSGSSITKIEPRPSALAKSVPFGCQNNPCGRAPWPSSIRLTSPRSAVRKISSSCPS